MSVLRSEYDLETNVDKVWYESSNVIYSEFNEHSDDNFGELYVVFKGGKRYLYRNVSFLNYLNFKNAVLNDGSSGKALNEYIIKNYPGEKVEDVVINDLIETLNKPDPKENTYFIHGDFEFDEFVFQGVYANTINYALDISSDCMFAVMFSDKYGMRSVKYMLDNEVNPSRIIIYMKESDVTEISEDESLCKLVKIKDERYDDDFIMSEVRRRSFEDITYIPQEKLEEIKRVSKSAYNILSRRMS